MLLEVASAAFDPHPVPLGENLGILLLGERLLVLLFELDVAQRSQRRLQRR